MDAFDIGTCVWVGVALLCWPLFAVVLVWTDGTVGDYDNGDAGFAVAIGFMGALIWPLLLPAGLVYLATYKAVKHKQAQR